MIKQTELAITIEPFDYSDASYAAMAEIDNAHYPDYPHTVEEMKRWDEKRLPEHHFYRCMARDCETGEIVAFGATNHDSGSFHPTKFWIGANVKPEFEGRGIGRKLYNHLLDGLASLNPTILEASTSADKARAVRFIEDRGFTLRTREYSSKLDLNTFDSSAFEPYVQRCADAGIDMVDVTELRERFPDDWLRRIYDATSEIRRDVPWHDTLTDWPYEVFADRFTTNPNLMHDTYLLALDGDNIVGVTMLFKSGATTDTLFTGLTGVKASHRRQGIAAALKVKVLNYAKTTFVTADGRAPSVMTENESNNPMFTINERMGFVRQPDFLMYRKEI